MSNKLRIVMTGGPTLIAELAPDQDLINLADTLSENDRIVSVTLVNGDAADTSHREYLRNLLGDSAVAIRADGVSVDGAAIPRETKTVMLTKDGKGAKWRVLRLHRVA